VAEGTITVADMDRVGVMRHAEGFDTREECRARRDQLKAQLDGSGQVDAGVCLLMLPPGEVVGVPYWTVAVLATAELTPRLVPRGQPVDLPDALWSLLLLRGYEAEQAQKRQRQGEEVTGGH
jgi:hypothetical protein